MLSWQYVIQHTLNIFHLSLQIQSPYFSTDHKPLEAPMPLAAGWIWLTGRKSRKRVSQGMSCPSSLPAGLSQSGCVHLLEDTAPVRRPSLYNCSVQLMGHYSLPSPFSNQIYLFFFYIRASPFSTRDSKDTGFPTHCPHLLLLLNVWWLTLSLLCFLLGLWLTD